MGSSISSLECSWDFTKNRKSLTMRLSKFLYSFIKRYLGTPSDIDADTLRSENEALNERNRQLEREVEELRQELENLRPSD